MKLIIVIMTALMVQASAAGFAQKITLSVKGMPIDQVLKKIKQQTGLDMLYGDDVLLKSKKINVELKDVPLDAALDRILEGQPFSYTIKEKTIIIKAKEPSLLDKALLVIQNNLVIQKGVKDRVKGRVVDEQGKPLPNASIRVKGKNTVINTNQSGEFEIKDVAENAILVISYVGYKTLEIPVKGAVMPLEIKLNVATSELEEVNVRYSTGYQILPKERVTGSFDIIDNKTFNTQVSTDILSRLEAVGNSVLVERKAGSPGMIIRGLGTISGTREPLIVVDNFPYDGNLNNLNPNDVENITILKDAAAASIWGTKASNGVIVITTKRGDFNQKLVVDVNANINVIDKPDLFYNKRASASEYIDLEKFLFDNKYRFADTSNISRPPFSPVYEILFKQKNNKISLQDANAQIDALRNLDVRNDFNNYMYQKAVNQQYALSLRGGSNNLAWIVSGGYDRDINELDSKFDRINLRIENTYKPIKNLEVNTGVFYTKTKNISGKSAYESIKPNTGSLPIYTRLADAQGNAVPVMRSYRLPYLDTVARGMLLDWNYYPLNDYQYSKTLNNTDDLVGKIGLKYKIYNALSLNILYQYEKQNAVGEVLNDEKSYYVRDLVNNFSVINKVSGTVTYNVPKGSILNRSYNTLISQQARALLSYDKSWGKNALYAVAGSEIRQARYQGETSTTYGYKDNILTYVPVNSATAYPTFVSGGLALIPDSKGFISTVNKFVSAFANAAYTYNDRYTLSASARKDASNLFGVKANERWQPLWSVGMAWNAANESFYKFDLIPYLKLRATYGFGGNVDQSKSAVTIISYLGLSQFTQTPIANVTKYNDPELKWERVRTFNIGFDFKTKGSVVTGSVEYFNKKGLDLFGRSLIDYSTGIGTGGLVKNVANMVGNGVDVSITSLNIRGALTWTTDLNFSYYGDKVTKYFLTSKQGSNFVGTTTTSVSAIEGKPVYAIYSYKWAGLDPATGDPQGYYNGQISKNYTNLMGANTTIDSLTYHGPAIPKFFGSFNNSFTWKNFSVTASILYKMGHYFRRESISYSSLFGGGGHADYAQRWKAPGDEKTTDVPSLIYPLNTARDSFYSGSEVLVEKGDNIRLQFLQLGYSFNKAQLKSIPVSGLQLFMNVNNVGIIWRANKLGIDPDFQSIPNPRSYAFGIKANL